MSITTIATVTICLTILLSAVLAQPDTKTLLSSIFNKSEQGPRDTRGTGIFEEIGKALTVEAAHFKEPPEIFEGDAKPVTKLVADVKKPIVGGVVTAVSSQCDVIKRILGVHYEQVKGQREPNLDQLALHYIYDDYSITYNINQAAHHIPQTNGFDPRQTLYIIIHGFTEDPSFEGVQAVSQALLHIGATNVVAFDGSSVIRWLYIQSSTYLRFMGEKLGEVLADMIRNGVDPSKIHLIGHSFGAHTAGFAGKRFTQLTNRNIGRITGLDPAGPCFSHVDEDLRLKKTDADFVDVIHTNDGVIGLAAPVGHVNYYPNNGALQPNCLLETCSHNRVWGYFAESVIDPTVYPAIKCKSWEAFKANSCRNVTSYMGFLATPGTKGKFYLQTAGKFPYGLGLPGTVYRSDRY